MSEAASTTATRPAAAPASLCPLCCEVNLTESPRSDVTLSNCNHHSCKACLAKWMEREESSGQTTPPTCPFCRSTICEQDVLTVLGRPFQPKEGSGQSNGTEEMDELTMQWIAEHTVPCRVCGAFIEKHSGCDLMECLCGYRFCYNCGVPGGTCECNGPRHGFLNTFYIDDAPIRDGRSGAVDLRSCIRRRTVRQERESKRNRRDLEILSNWMFSDINAAICTANGRWLFSPKENSGCISMLVQQLSHDRINADRDRESYLQSHESNSCNADATWLFLPKGSNIRAMQQLLARDDIRSERAFRMKRRDLFPPKTSLDVSWIFVRRGAEVKVFWKRMLGHYVRMRKNRLRRRFALESEKQPRLDAPWLFLRQGADMQVMKQYLAGDSVRINRRCNSMAYNALLESSNCSFGDLNTIWLFLPVDTGMKILRGQKQAMRRRAMRAKVTDDDMSFGETDDLILGGVWIFQNTTPTASYNHLVQLFEKLYDQC